MSELILLDIFSYSCMNCLRSLNYINKIYSKYKKYGLKTIIIHPPEWEFEKNINNIIQAFKKYNIRIPVIIDKNKRFIKKLKVNFWPTQILVSDGKILYKHIGEGNYKELENIIKKKLKIKLKSIFDKEPKYSKLPTLYFGRKKGKILRLDGWVQKQEYIKSLKNNSSLTILTKGNLINFVAESLDNKPAKIKIKLNNKKIKTISIDKPQLYKMIGLKKTNRQSRLTLITDKNLAVYSFSFQ